MKDKVQKIIVILTACLPALIFVIWLNAYYWLLEGGRYKAFMQPKLWPLLVLALIMLLAFTAALISRFSTRSIVSLKIERWINAAILILPVVFLWTTYGQSLGVNAFAKRVLQTGQSVFHRTVNLKERQSRGFSGNTTSLLDLILDAEHFNGKRVAVEGMVYLGKGGEINSFELFRFAVACCAADALPFSIKVKSAAEENLHNDTWVRVEGRFNLDIINGKQVTSIVADKVLSMPTPPPEKRYLFF